MRLGARRVSGGGPFKEFSRFRCPTGLAAKRADSQIRVSPFQQIVHGQGSEVVAAPDEQRRRDENQEHANESGRTKAHRAASRVLLPGFLRHRPALSLLDRAAIARPV